MELRSVFTRDLIGDRELLATYVFCLADVQQLPSASLHLGDVIDLRPYEILVEWDCVERDLKMSKDLFISKLELLQRMRRLTFRLDRDYCKVIMALQFPIGGSDETKKTNDGEITVKLSRWIEIDLDQIVKLNFSKRYHEMVRQVLNRFLKVVGDKLLTEITVYDYREYVRVLQKGEATNSSVSNYRRVLVASLSRAITAGYLKDNKIKPEKPLSVSRSRPKIVEREELESLFKQIRFSWLKNVIEFALLSGKRHGEILNLKWEDIDKQRKTIWIHSSEKYHVKFGKEQDLPLSKPLETLINRIEAEQRSNGVESDYVFVDENGKHLRMKKVQEVMKEAKDAAGLGDHVTIHALRRTTATILKQKNVPTNTIKVVLNHENEKTTNRYLGVPRDDEIAALNQLSLPDFFPT